MNNYTREEIRQEYANNVEGLVFNNDFLPSLQNT